MDGETMMRTRARALSGIVLLAVCGVALAGCGSGGSSGASSAAPNVAANRAPGQYAAGGQAQAQVPDSNRAAQPLSVPGRQVVRTATIGVRVTNLNTAEGTVRQIAAAAGGYAGQEDDQSRQASFTLQVPQAKLDAALDQLSRLGTTTSRTEQTQDVTSQLVDVQSRLSSQRSSVNRVRALMDRATTIGDVVSIEGELTKREADLESMQQQQAELAGQVAMSTVTVQLSEATVPVAAASSGPIGFVSGLGSGWHAFLGALSVLLVVLGAVLPFLVVFGGLGGVAWWLVRRRRSAALAAGGAGPVGEK
jgi:hypothetical protein